LADTGQWTIRSRAVPCLFTHHPRGACRKSSRSELEKPDMKAHNVYQIRKDVALGVRAMHRTSDKSFAELHSRLTCEI
jgi:hypothetical protein